MPSKATLKRKPGKTRSKYVSRLVKNKTMQKKYKDPKQRVAVAHSYLRQSTNKSKSKSKSQSKTTKR